MRAETCNGKEVEAVDLCGALGPDKRQRKLEAQILRG